MSTQMEFIMQLYMMNLMQQQQQLLHQQQQHQLQQQQQTLSPLKLKDIIPKATPTTHTTTTPIENLKIKNTKNSKANTTNTCSSSRSSCSTNSNTNSSIVQPSNYYNPITATSLSLQQMLLNNFAPMTQLLSSPTTPTSVPPPAMSSNLLLTPNTPGSGNGNMMLDLTTSSAMAQTAYACGNNVVDNIFAFSHHNNNRNSISLANNFLQSSTVTSTPTDKSPTTPLLQHALEDQDVSSIENGCVDGAAVAENVAEDATTSMEIKGETVSSVDSNQTEDAAGNEEEDDDEAYDAEDEQPLSSIYASSAEVASSSAESATVASKLLCSGVQNLESTLDSMESPSMLHTPIKQPADSSLNEYNVQNFMSLCKEESGAISSSQCDLSENEDSNVSPLTKATNAMLTPPSSEQLMSSSASAYETQSQSMQLNTASSLEAFLQNEDNLKNLKKFSSYLECENVLCRQENLREHFHCFDEPCKGKILSKKDDIIRHLKWHKKRRESLLLGFARFSSSDDCEPTYGAGCTYNWKQTHYHCVYEDCPKVYVSTSDVQMHANFHRKNSEIVQEGFRRFRAHEDCKTEDCPFYGKKISHYHCCREGCQHTFKNKADMDKHKSYHLKDFQLTQDGFKKILKTEVCTFEGCKFSGACNHIHCVRESCNYILHSSSQMISHKRKHDRLDGEQAYQQFKKQKDSSEEESPKPTPAQSNNSNSHVSTPLSSLSAEHFLARKRGRPPKKIQLPADATNKKRIKYEDNKDQLTNTATANNPMPSLYPPYLPNFNPAAAAAAAAMAAAQDTNAPNFQLTHLMALFQLQNPLFFQNLYPGGMAANMATNLLGAAAAGTIPSSNILGNLSACGGISAAMAATAGSAAAAAEIKLELNDKQNFKE